MLPTPKSCCASSRAFQVPRRSRSSSHKVLKGLQTQNLRDHMSEAELIFTALAELSTRQIAETTDATGHADQPGHDADFLAEALRHQLEQSAVTHAEGQHGADEVFDGRHLQVGCRRHMVGHMTGVVCSAGNVVLCA